MNYQVSLEGHIGRNHVQFDHRDYTTFEGALREVRDRKFMARHPSEEYIALLFDDRNQAVMDGVPFGCIEDVWGDKRLFRYRARILSL